MYVQVSGVSPESLPAPQCAIRTVLPPLYVLPGMVSAQVRALVDASPAGRHPGDQGDSSDAIRRLKSDIMSIIGGTRKAPDGIGSPRPVSGCLPPSFGRSCHRRPQLRRTHRGTRTVPAVVARRGEDVVAIDARTRFVVLAAI